MNSNKENSNKKINIKNNNIVKHTVDIEELEKIKDSKQVVDMYVKEIDEFFNMNGVIGKNINAVIPRQEASSILNENLTVDEKYIVNKKDKVIPVCIKDVIIDENNKVKIIASKKLLEMKVRKWMYSNLKMGSKLKGTVVNFNDTAAFIDVGGGVIGILRISEITNFLIMHPKDILRIGQRITLVVKNFDKDTGKIELSRKNLILPFSDRVKKIKENEIIEGIVRNRIKTGIIIQIGQDLVGISEHVNGLEYGQKVLVSIKKIQFDKEKIKLIIIG